MDFLHEVLDINLGFSATRLPGKTKHRDQEDIFHLVIYLLTATEEEKQRCFFKNKNIILATRRAVSNNVSYSN